VNFLGCVLVGGCVWTILGFLYGLKEEFYGEIKCEFVKFWIEKETMKACFRLLLGENKGESNKRHSNQHIARLKSLKQ